MSTENEGRILSLYSEECIVLLRKALEYAVARQSEEEPITATTSVSAKSRYADSSSPSSNDDEDADDSLEDGGSSSSSSSSEDENDDVPGESATSEQAENGALLTKTDRAPAVKKIKKRTKMDMDERQRIFAVRKHFGGLSCIALTLPLEEDSSKPTANHILEIPSSLLSKEDRHHVATTTSTVRSLLELATALQQRPVVVLSLRSGRFAAAVFDGKGCIAHTTSTRYTVRKGQGKAQSAQDGQRRAKSVGSQLRRAGEQALQEDVVTTLRDWNRHIQTAALILLAVPKTMFKTVWEADVITKDDARIRRVPLDTGRPTFESVCMIHSVMTTTMLKQQQQQREVADEQVDQPIADDSSPASNDQIEIIGGEVSTGTEPTYPELADIHVFARDGDVESLRNILSVSNNNNSIHPEVDVIDLVNAAAGPDYMTPLHFAAHSTTTTTVGVDAATAAECVSLLLLAGRANPCQVDARNRPSYFLASHEKVREAFRMARAALGEQYCRWDEGAKVGPPLTLDDIQAKKEKEAEKRRKKKVRQKELKQKEKLLAEEAERARIKEEERQKQEEEAKRIRDGLAPKVISSSGATCDFCQTVCKGRKRNQMLKRLEYSYCSTDCVQKHKRELMAAAALKRFGDH